ncbi:MAG: EF-hand domain-containing protein [Polyangiales bacterium]|nr:EF-hand domain-containing protein [Sandaracinaceae bacterium]
MTDTFSAFGEYDKDGNGEIDLLEFRELVAALGLELDRAQAEALFDSIDTDEEGTIDYEEFQTWWTSREK